MMVFFYISAIFKILDKLLIAIVEIKQSSFHGKLGVIFKESSDRSRTFLLKFISRKLFQILGNFVLQIFKFL
jgi:hypothetical protein